MSAAFIGNVGSKTSDLRNLQKCVAFPVADLHQARSCLDSLSYTSIPTSWLIVFERSKTYKPTCIKVAAAVIGILLRPITGNAPTMRRQNENIYRKLKTLTFYRYKHHVILLFDDGRVKIR